MKHEKEIDELLRSVFYEDWMSEEEYIEVETEILATTKKTKQDLSDDIEVGIENGYTVEQQMKLTKMLMGMLKKK